MERKDSSVKVKVDLNQQQRELIRKAREAQIVSGRTDEEIVLSIFRQWLKEEGLK